MKVSETISLLKNLPQNQEIIITWWDSDVFDLRLSSWEQAVQKFESEGGFGNIIDGAIWDYIQDLIDSVGVA